MRCCYSLHALRYDPETQNPRGASSWARLLELVLGEVLDALHVLLPSLLAALCAPPRGCRAQILPIRCTATSATTMIFEVSMKGSSSSSQVYSSRMIVN